jgi:TonB family protein
MSRYRLIHPERPALRAAVAVLVSIAIHVAALALLGVWARAALAAARKAEAERPREVALADVDPARWEENRRHAEPPAQRPSERMRPEERSAVAMIAPGDASRPPTDGAAGSPAPAPQSATSEPPPERMPGPESEGPGPRGGALDLQPRPTASRPLVMRFDPTSAGQVPYSDGTGFGGLTVQTPEAWRFTNFFGRAVEAMNSVYRYELGAPMPPSLHAQWLANPRRGGGCSMTSVSIGADGKVVEARVRKSSGMGDLDELIVEVIRRTAPFVNVPPGLLGERGLYSDTWGLCILWGAGGG